MRKTQETGNESVSLISDVVNIIYFQKMTFGRQDDIWMKIMILMKFVQVNLK